MDRKSSLENPNPNKTTMAFQFTKALAHIRSSTPRSSSFHHRRRRITRAAYVSMAVAAAPRRAWSRALLRRLRSSSSSLRRHGSQAQRVNIISRRRIPVPRSGQVETLRGLVPGGEDMDLCHLLEESASYIQCLTTQVTLMQSIVESISI